MFLALSLQKNKTNTFRYNTKQEVTNVSDVEGTREGRSNLTEENLLSSMAASRTLFLQSPFPVLPPILTYQIRPKFDLGSPLLRLIHGQHTT